MTIESPARPSHGFGRRLTLALTLLASIAVVQGGAALWAIGQVERHLLRGRVAADIKQGFTDLRSDKQQLRTWLAQQQFGAGAGSTPRDALLERMGIVLADLKGLAAQAVRLDDSPAARQRQAERAEALRVLEGSLAQLGRGLASLNPVPPGTDPAGAWRLANDLFDRAEGRDLRLLLAESIEREDTALREKRADTDAALALLSRSWIGSTAALVLVALVLAAYFTRALRGPLRGLAEGAAALRRGDLSHRIPAGGTDEFADVGRSMNAMAAELAEHRRMETEARSALEEQVAVRTAELRAALDAQSDAEARRRQLFADISHELRTPTTAIRGEAQVALRGADKPIEDYRGSLRRIEDASRHLSLAIDDLLTMARSDIDALSLRRVPLDLVAILDDLLSSGEAIARAGGVSLDHAPWPAVLPVIGDADRLRQLLLAVLDNAVRYSRPGQAVRLEAVRVDGEVPRVEIRIRDEGIGIAAEDLPRVFDRSHRAPNAISHRADGSGLGLPIARVLARGHGGEITLASVAGRGTTATVTLPLAVEGTTVSA
ncbi:sensor histidine kinase [Phreatobacter oligotrophus]|uniref:histidine kinase n=1 Tax=Phreatobacter oligotrophus TaxID=1122261 RepID=A0A2T4YXX4_9HYPH|nr:ATP-binding protein [Phreatobacter oligotrophus]PTM51385.1 phospho-acceptor domain-containing protein [Phreatobacter oligotrophus]